MDIRFILHLFVWLLRASPASTDGRLYQHVWTVHIDGDVHHADQVAAKHNFTNKGQIGSLEGHYAFTHQTLSPWSPKPSHHVTHRLSSEETVVWAEQQVSRTRRRRQIPHRKNRSFVNVSTNFNDVKWPLQWYMNGERHRRSMNVLSAWEQGFTGNGVVVTILDDGIEHTHQDLRKNYDPLASWDVNDHDPDPMPRYDKDNLNRHGTRCAGEVAASANNSVCIVGVAYNAKIGGVRMLDGLITDMVEAISLNVKPQHVDIYSSSWGPNDDGGTVDGPGNLGIKALIQGIKRGRSGKGSIYVWASGNGGSYGDSCACDGYTTSIFTISISSATERGTVPFYLEECAAILSTTYSSGDEDDLDRSVVTTTLRNGCATDHSGTSASAPLAAGIIALTLEANKNLTWRDVQHIIVRTSRWRPLVDGNWITNGAGRNVSHRYGFGVMDTQAMVTLATGWTSVPEHHTCIHRRVVNRKSWKPFRRYVIRSDGCTSVNRGCQVRFLEHVQLKIQLAYPNRGGVLIHVTSPSGTRSVFLPRRSRDHSYTRYYRSPFGVFWKWPLMSTHFWGENPTGNWTISIFNTDAVGEIKLIMHGTSRDPYARRSRGHQRHSSDTCHVDLVDLYTFPKVRKSSLIRNNTFFSDFSANSTKRRINPPSSFVASDVSITWANITVPVVLCLLAAMVAVTTGVLKRLRITPCFKNAPSHHESSANLYDDMSNSSSGSDVNDRDDSMNLTSSPLIEYTDLPQEITSNIDESEDEIKAEDS